MKKIRQIIFIQLLCFMLCQSVGFAQGDGSSRWYDSTTYAYYLKSDWQMVQLLGNEALKKGFDFFYLRVRMGDAWLYSGNYRKAVSQYNAALHFNSADEYSSEMKYFACLDLGQLDRADKLSSTFSPAQKDRLKLKKSKPVDFVYLETGISPSTFKNKDRRRVIGSDSIYGERVLQTSLNYLHLGARFRIKPSIYFYAGYTGMGIEREKLISFATTGLQRTAIVDTTYGRAYYYNFFPKITDTSFRYRLKQDDIYVNADYYPADGWKVSPALHYFNIRSQQVIPAYQTFTKSDTAYYVSITNTYFLFDYQSDSYNFIRKDTSFSNYLLSLSVSREAGLFNLEFHASHADFNSAKQDQLGVGATFYPFGNSKLYGAMKVTSLFSGSEKRMILEPSLGGNIMKNLWLSGLATYGNLDLYNDNNGYVIYNQVDPIHFRAGIDGLICLRTHMELFLVYRYYQKEYATLQYAAEYPSGSDPVLVPVLSKTSYSNQSFIGGIKWKF
jgi:hypothetical protein